MNAQAGRGVGPIRWDVLPQWHTYTKEIASALFLSRQAEELRDMSGVMFLFLLVGTGMLPSEHGQGCPFLLQCAVERRHQYKTKIRSPFQMLSHQL